MLSTFTSKKNLGLLLSETRTSVRGHFLVIASGASSLLLKTIATRELMLPFDFERETEKPPEDAMRLVEKSLSRVKIVYLIIYLFIYLFFSLLLLIRSTLCTTSRISIRF